MRKPYITLFPKYKEKEEEVYWYDFESNYYNKSSLDKIKFIFGFINHEFLMLFFIMPIALYGMFTALAISLSIFFIVVILFPFSFIFEIDVMRFVLRHNEAIWNTGFSLGSLFILDYTYKHSDDGRGYSGIKYAIKQRDIAFLCIIVIALQLLYLLNIQNIFEFDKYHI